MVVLPEAKEDQHIEKSISLLDWLKKAGRLKQTTQAQMYKARHQYVTKGEPPQIIADGLRVPVEVIEQWIMLFDWKEMRHKALFEKFVELREIRERRKEQLDDRHDRIALTLEETIESMLHDHNSRDSDFALMPRDISALAKAVSVLQGVRRVAHNKASPVQESRRTIAFESADAFGNMESMIAGFFGATPKAIEGPSKQLDISEAKDAEFEVICTGQRPEEDQELPPGTVGD
jgi:hypothetical protein